jgi:hypothetical protein
VLTHACASHLLSRAENRNLTRAAWEYGVLFLGINASSLTHGNPHLSLAAMPGRVPLMAAGSRRALGEIGNQIGGGLTTRNGAKEQAVKCVDSPVHFRPRVVSKTISSSRVPRKCACVLKLLLDEGRDWGRETQAYAPPALSAGRMRPRASATCPRC